MIFHYDHEEYLSKQKPLIFSTMKITFPVYRKVCDTCKSRFECMTTRYKLSHSVIAQIWINNLPHDVELSCFKIEPYNLVAALEFRRYGGGIMLTIKGVSANG